MADERNYPERRNKNEIELYYIYIVLGRLRSLMPTTIGRLKINQSIFPKRFVYKLINDRLKETGELAANLVAALFRRLRGESEQRIGEQLVDARVRQRAESNGASTLACPELDEYFHCTLCNIHDFLTNLDWHEPILEELPSKSDYNYIRSNLPHLRDLIEFRKLLVDKNALKMVPVNEPKTTVAMKAKVVSTLDATSNTSMPKVIRSSLARRSPESPGPRRRVRFNDSREPAKNIHQDNPRVRKYIKESHSILALDLTLFALNMFVNELKRQLFEWSLESTASMKESMQLIRMSKRKLRVNKLIFMAKDREVSNAVHANIMNSISDIENIYLLNHFLSTVCAQDEERLLKIYKQPHVRTFVNEFLRIEEKDVLNLMATQILEILFELAICEINMPPMELTGGRRNKSREGVANKTGQENYLNFVASWLNLDKILFGSKVQAETVVKQSVDATRQAKGSSANSGFDFKSSSRILNQMDNLHELMRHILTDLVGEISSERHVEYCLHLLHRGMSQCLELIARQLEVQLNSTREALLAQQKQALRETNSAERLNSTNADRIAIKIRYLKLIHISSSMDNLIKELSQGAAVSVTTDSKVNSGKLSRLIDECTRQMESI